MNELEKQVKSVSAEIKALRTSLHSDIQKLGNATFACAEMLEHLSAIFTGLAEEFKERLENDAK